MSRSAQKNKVLARRGHFGLYYKDAEGITQPIPLKSIDVNVKIMESIARVEYSQVYQNNTSNTLHVDYIFPISTGSCFESFSVKYKSYTMEGEIHKKEHAKKKFKEAVKEGKTAVYAEISEESKDLMLVKIGNMEPDTSMTISLSYIEQLDTSANKLWKYTVLGGLKPRYSSSSAIGNVNQNTHDQDISILNYPYITSTDSGAYTWKIKVEIEAKSKISFVECPAYKIQTEYEEMVKAIIQLDPSEQFTPTKDFTIYYSTEGINKPQALLTCYEDGYCALLNFMPQTNQKSLDDAYRAELENDGVPDIEFEKTNSEFIFLLDRSGSMSGSSIRMAREALVIFLKSIPAKSYFNIVSFGGHYEIYNKSGSLPATQDNISDATRDVMRYEGDMGGTEILKALEAVYQLKSQPDCKKKIFLLTDGEVTANAPIYRSIQKHIDEARVFSIGIGASACRELIIQSALYGKGCYEFVDDVKKIGERVVSLLSLSMQICAHSFQLTFPLGLNANMVVPHPEIVGPVYEGKYLSFFVYFDKHVAKRESVKLSLIYKRDEQTEGAQQTIELVMKDCLSDANPLNNAIWKLGYHKLFSLFENDKDKSTDSLVLFGGAPLTRHNIEPLSVKYGVLSSKTAFVCVSKDVNNNVLSTVHSEVVVPHVLDTERSATKGRRNRSRSRSGGRSRRRSRSRSSSSSSCEEEMLLALPPKKQLATKAARKSSPLTGGVNLKKKMATKARRSRSRSRERAIKMKSKRDRSRSGSMEREKQRDRDRSRKRKTSPERAELFQRSFGQKEEMCIEFETENPTYKFKADNDVRSQLLERLANNTYGSRNFGQAPKQESSYDQVFSLIRQQDSKGNWGYTQGLLNELGVDEKALENLVPEAVKQMKCAQAIIMTALVLICLKKKYAEHKKIWTLVFKKGEGFLKQEGVALQDFKSFESLW